MSSPQPIRLKSPLIIGLIGFIAVATIIIPVAALGLRVPWARIGEYLALPEIRDMLLISVAAAFQSMLLALVLGLGLALWVQQLGRGSAVIRLLVYLPLAMPPVVGGLALTAAFGRRGYLAPLLDALGIHLAFAFPGVVVAQTFVALPFVVVAVDSALRQLDEEILASARSVGLGRWEILGKITLPSIAPALATGTGLAFARSLGEFGTTLTFAGSQPGVTRTMPLGIYLEREVDADGAYVLSALLIGLALLCLTLAGLPVLRRRHYQPRARKLHTMDVDKLRELTRPAEAPAISVQVDGARTDFSPRAITAIVGPNGSGKTTLMGRIAGRLSGGEVTPKGTDIVLLTQRPGLPPRSTALKAVSMVTRDRARAQELLAAAGLHELADVPVPALSGGQAAHVALVRALAARPAVLILDEPLAAVDVKSAERWRRFLHAAREDRTTLLVTHNALDIANLARDMLVMDSGRVEAHDTTARLLNAPPSGFVAALAGLNRLEGTVTGIGASTTEVTCGDIVILATTEHATLQPGQKVAVTFDPQAAALNDAANEDNQWDGRVVAIEAISLGSAQVRVGLGGQEVTVPVDRETALGIAAGDTVSLSVSKTRVFVHPKADSYHA
ncbi:ABC transporter permease subunit [Corynebacterium sp. c8Ua_181]|uniref:ABC transporter permease subunit n=1 Tax=Corynebacterium curieae TaxID=2913500 RepID=A0A9X3MBS7_9CORY|nr:ATP-binding cassette domain-containing protein [Corynebacterium curieae]MCZ9306760.1 ABC transporter permease subunit [Corynebacterium curieae]